MSDRSSRESVASTSQPDGSGGEPSGTVKSTPTQCELWNDGSQTPTTSETSPSGCLWPTPLRGNQGNEGGNAGGMPLRKAIQLTSSAEASPASPSVSPGNSLHRMTLDGSGRTSHESFASYDPTMSLSKTCPDFSQSDSNSMSRLTDAYAAGLVDGEGCLYLTRRRKAYAARMDMGMSAKGLPLLEEMASRYGGTVRLTRKASERWEAAHCWTVTGKKVAPILRLLVPHLRIKREQAEILLRFQDMIDSLSRRPNGTASWTDKGVERAGAMSLRIKELNQKGPRHSPTMGSWFAQLAGGKWVTTQRDFLSDLGWATYSETFPPSGTMRNGKVYRRQRLVPRIDAIESGLLPTPSQSYGTNQGGAAGRVGPGRPSLETMARKNLWPTPRSEDSQCAGAHRGKPDSLYSATKMWPTPQAHDYTGPNTRSVGKERPVSHDDLPTRAGGQLNPTWVEWLMGFPLEWTALDVSETPSSRKSRSGSSGR